MYCFFLLHDDTLASSSMANGLSFSCLAPHIFAGKKMCGLVSVTTNVLVRQRLLSGLFKLHLRPQPLCLASFVPRRYSSALHSANEPLVLRWLETGNTGVFLMSPAPHLLLHLQIIFLSLKQLEMLLLCLYIIQATEI